MDVCNDFLCQYNVDDTCNDYTVLCGDCLYLECCHCVYYHRVSEFVEECTLQDGCGRGQTFSP